MTFRPALVVAIALATFGIDGVSPYIATAADSNPTPRVPSLNSNLVIDTPPVRGTNWQVCEFAAQEYCYEPVSMTNEAGVETVLPFTSYPSAGTPSTNCHNNVASTDFCAMDGSDWIEVGLGGTFTAADMKNTYHWKLRTGKFEPDIMMLGDTQKSVVAGDASSGWTLEIWAKPAIKAYLNGCYSASTCGSDSVAWSVRYGIEGYARMLGIDQSWPSVATEQLRDALRGTYISTNGMSQSWTFKQDWFYVTAVSPHFLPPVNGAPSEVTPGYVKVFLPEKYFTLDRGYKDLTLVTANNVKMKVSGQDATANLSAQNGGILIDTGVTHFSAPNPEFSVLKAGETVSTVVPVTAAPVVTPVLPTFKKGASKSLSSLARTSANQKPKWAATGSCKIVGSKLVALKKPGKCTAKLRVLNSKKKYVVKTTKTYNVE